MYREIIGKIAIPIFDKLSGRDLLVKKSVLARDAQLPVEHNHKIQRDMLAKMLKHAITTVPFYRPKLSDLGQQIHQHNALEVLQEFPIMTKGLVRKNFSQLISTKKNIRSRKVATGGSTGEPTVILKDIDNLNWLVAAEMLFYEWAGYFPGIKLAKVWGSERDIFEGTLGLKNRIQNFLMNRDFINTFCLKISQLPTIAKQIQRYRESRYLVYGYAESMYLLSRYFNDNSIEFPKPLAVLTTAGTLYPEMRRMIQQVFQCPVMNKYGSREINSIACECTQMNGLHIPPRLNYVEILDKNDEPCRRGEIGELAITSLTNYAMPLIRYKLGDMAMVATEDCGCHLGFPIISQIIGRTSDVFETAHGDLVHGEFFSHIFYDFPWVSRFRVTQHSYSEFAIEIEEMSEINGAKKSKLESTIADRIATVFGENTKISFLYISELAVPESGKFRFTISKVRQTA